MSHLEIDHLKKEEREVGKHVKRYLSNSSHNVISLS